MVEKVLVGGDIQLRQELLVLGSDAEEVGDGRIESGFAPRSAGFGRGCRAAGLGFGRFPAFCFRSWRGIGAQRLQGGGDRGGAVVRVEFFVVKEAGKVRREAFGLEVLLKMGDEARESAGDDSVVVGAAAFELQDAAQGVESGGTADFIRAR
jgi:hypothetical protein